MGRHYRKRSNFYRASRPYFGNPGIHIPVGVPSPTIFIDAYGPYVVGQIGGLFFESLLILATLDLIPQVQPIVARFLRNYQKLTRMRCWVFQNRRQ